MEFSKKKLPKVDSFRGFIGKLKCNPMTKEKIVVAKDSSYPYQKSEDAYVLLLPLAVKNVYMYVQPYIDAKTNVTEHCLRIGRITDLSLSDNSQIYVYNGSAQNDIRFNDLALIFLYLYCDSSTLKLSKWTTTTIRCNS